MDREVLMALLSLLLGGSASVLCGWWPGREDGERSGRKRERTTWRRLWLPLLPAGLVFAALCGWALLEPEDAEPLPARFVAAALPFGAVLVRALARAVRSLTREIRDPAAATVGLFRPRVIVSARFAAVLDARALEAACAHEGAHARHRDPLRLWLAQLAADLQWPWPAACRRLRAWSAALELARDEEARLTGIAGVDLAAAVLAGARLAQSAAPAPAAAVVGSGEFLRERVTRLLEPLSPDPGAMRGALGALVTALAAAVFLGARLGESVFAAIVVGR